MSPSALVAFSQFERQNGQQRLVGTRHLDITVGSSVSGQPRELKTLFPICPFCDLAHSRGTGSTQPGRRFQNKVPVDQHLRLLHLAEELDAGSTDSPPPEQIKVNVF